MKGNQKVVSMLQTSLRQGRRIFLAAPSLGELYEGAFRSTKPNTELQRISDLLSLLSGILPFDEQAARHFGKLMATLLQHGKKVPDIDVQIAAIALTHRLAIVSGDHHLQMVARFTALTVHSWR